MARGDDVMRSPVVAMLWENWRLTRLEAAWKLALGIVAASTVLMLVAVVSPQPEGVDARTNEPIDGFGAAIAFAILIAPHLLSLWLSVSKLKGGRSGGFPFSLLFVRPVRTAVLVGVPMAYQAALSATVYLVSALILRSIFDYPFPLLSVAASIAAFHLVSAAADWSPRNQLTGSLGVGAAGLAFMAAFGSRGGAFRLDGGLQAEAFRRWPAQFDFSVAEYALIAAIGLASFGVAIAGVARQRRGETKAAMPWSGGFQAPRVSWLRFRCPTASATRAQVWFDLKSGGLPVLAIGATLAIVNPLLFAVSVPLEPVRALAVMIGLFSPVAVLAFGNAFGIRWKQGRSHSAFEAIQPQGTTWMASLKVLVRSGCVLAALSAIGVSVWASLSFIAVGEAYEPLRGYEPLRSWQHAIEAGIAAMTGYQRAALAIVVSVGVAVMVAARASLGALWTRYPRRMNIAGWLLMLHGLALLVLAMTGYRGKAGSETLWAFALDALVWVTRWIDAPAVVFATVYVTWRTLAERLLTPRAVCLAGLASGVFAAAWVTLLHAAGVELAGLSTIVAGWMLSPVLLPLMASVLASWSLSRVRHA
jgi:hypothetical protein